MRTTLIIFVFALLFASCASVKPYVSPSCAVATDVCEGIAALCAFLNENVDSLSIQPAKLDATLVRVDSLEARVHTELHAIMDDVAAKQSVLKKIRKSISNQ